MKHVDRHQLCSSLNSTHKPPPFVLGASRGFYESNAAFEMGLSLVRLCYPDACGPTNSLGPGSMLLLGLDVLKTA